MINRGVVGCQIELKPAERGRPVTDKAKSAGDRADLSFSTKEGIIKNIQPELAAIRAS
jgi:hypothetical protein